MTAKDQNNQPEALKCDLTEIAMGSGPPAPRPLRFHGIYYPLQKGCRIEPHFGCKVPGWVEEFFPGEQAWGAPKNPTPELDARLEELNRLGKEHRDPAEFLKRAQGPEHAHLQVTASE